MKSDKVIITQQAVEVVKSIITNQERDFVVKAELVSQLLNKKSPTYSEGLSNGYKQGAIDTLRLLGILKPTTTT